MSIRDFKNARNLGQSEPEPEVEEAVEPEVEQEAADTATPNEEPVEEEVTEEPTEEDWSWAAELKEFRELHGVPIAEIAKAIAEGRIPDALMTKLKVKLKNGDEEWEDTLEGARAGNMRYRDYTRKRQADAAEKAQWTAEKEELMGLHHAWKSDSSGKALLRDLQSMGYPMLEAAKLLAAEHAKLAEMTPAERDAYERAQKAERELEQMRWEQQKARRAQEAASSKETVERNVQFVTNTANKFFQAHGVPMNKGTWGVFLRQFDAIRAANPNQQWNEEMVQIAVGATKEEYEQLRKEMGGVAPQVAPKKPQVVQQATPARAQLAQAGMGPQRFDSGKPPQPASKKGETVADIRRRFMGR